MAAMKNDETETDISATDDRDPLEPMQKKIKLVEYLDSPSLPEEILSSSNNYTKNPEMTDTKENVRELKKDVELLKEKHRKLKLVATYKKKWPLEELAQRVEDWKLVAQSAFSELYSILQPAHPNVTPDELAQQIVADSELAHVDDLSKLKECLLETDI